MEDREISSSDAGRMEEFISLLSANDQALTAYIVAMVPSYSDAQDILQETKVALWKDFDSFEPGTNFGAWSRRTALHRVLDFRRKKGRENKRLWFSENCYELLAEEFELGLDAREARIEKLRDCIAKLQPGHREILLLRYFRDSPVEEVAGRVNRSVEATYRVLSRIRLALRKCIISAS